MNMLAILVVSATATPVWTWENPTPHGATVAALHGEGSMVWGVGPRGAIVRSTDGGVTWAALESGVLHDLTAITGAGSLVIAVGNGGTVLRARDGLAFEAQQVDPAASFVGVAMVGTTVLTVASDGAVWRSKDSGASFTAMPKRQLGRATSIAIAPSGVFVGTSDGLFRSTDGGATFTRVFGEPVQRIVARGESIHALAGATIVYPSLQVCGSCMNASYDVIAIYRSRDGKTWERRTLEDPTTAQHAWGPPTAHVPRATPPASAVHGHRGVGAPGVRPAWLGRTALAIGPAGEIYATSGALHVSVDGTTFAKRPRLDAVLWATSKLLLAGGAHGDLAWSRDHGATFQSSARGLDVIAGRMTATPDGRVLAIASDGAIVARDKGWTKVALPIRKQQRLTDIFALDANHVIAIGEGGLLLKSTDGGRTFVHRASDSTQDLVSVWGAGDEVFAAGREGLMQSLDRGATWESVGAKGYRMGLLWGTSPTDLWLVGSGVKHSTDRGRTWRDVEVADAWTFLAMWGSGSDRILVGRDGKIMHSSDRGTTWKARSSGTTTALYAVWGHDNLVFAIGSRDYDRGPVVLHSRDRGKTWSEEPIHADIALRAIVGTKDAVFVAGSGHILRRELP
ncbi:MAG: WD40/YVTN/BNR-like repeat-containing protein [Kofleriaceae bacterium]